MRRGHVVHQEDVLDVLLHIRALDVVGLQVVERHHHHIGVHLHHQRDGALWADVVGHQARHGLGQLEHLVVRVVRHVVDDAARMREHILDGPLEVLVEARALGIEHQVLVGDAEEALVVGLLALGERVALPPLAFGRILAADGVQRVDLDAALGQIVVVDVLRRLHYQVAGHLHQYRREVRAYPVEGQAGGHHDAQHQGQAHGKPVGHVLLFAGLLALQRVDAVLRIAQAQRRGHRRHRPEPGEAAVEHRDEPQVLGAGDARFRDGVHDIHQAEQDEDLDGQGHERDEGMVVALLVQLGLALTDGLAVAEMLGLDAVQLGHQLHHRERVLLAPQRHGHQDDLRRQREQQDSHPPVTRQVVARLQQQVQGI